MTTALPNASERAQARGVGRPARVLFMTDAFLPHAGGARVYYYNLLRHLVDDSPTELTVLTKKVPGWKEFDEAQSSSAFRIVRCGRPLVNWKYQQWPKLAIPLARALPLLLRHSFDLIHFGDLFPQGVLGLWFKRSIGIPYVAYCHGEEITQTDGRRYQPRVRDAIFRNADTVIAANEFARQNLLRTGVPAGRIEKVLPGIDSARFKPAVPEREFIDRYRLQGKQVLTTVARLVPRKGHRLVLEAMRNLSDEFPDLVYLIVGRGPEEVRLRDMAAQWNLTERVRFTGFVNDKDLPACYNAADLYVMPNSEENGDLEGFGMAFIEANACGKAVIGGRSGGTAESILEGQTGLRVDPGDPGELIASLRFLLRDSAARERMGTAGLARARSDFSWAVGARTLASVNTRIISARRAHSRSLHSGPSAR